MGALQAAVRPLVTIMFAGALTYGFVVGVVSTDAFLGIAGAAIGFYFQKREEPKPPTPAR